MTSPNRLNLLGYALMVEIPDKFLAAVIALSPLPGSPRFGDSEKEIVEKAVSDCELYINAGVDSVVIENSFDIPYVKPPLPLEALKAVSQACKEVRRIFSGPVGLQLLEGANEAALDIAMRAKLDFLRVEGYCFAHVGGAGIIEGCAGQLHRRKRELGRSDLLFFADVKKKHCSHALTGDLTIGDEAHQAEFFMADGMIVTGARTMVPPAREDIEAVREATTKPVLIGSGITGENIEEYFPLADGFIVGSTFRRDGLFQEEIDKERLGQFVKVFGQLRRGGD